MGNDETESDGVLQLSDFLSRPAEWHAATHGLFKGFTRVDPRPTYDDSKEEPHYFRAGYVVGYLLKAGVVAGAAYVGSGMV